MKIAVEGCAHGDLEKIYEVIATLEKENSIKVDLLICCGDFQAVRCVEDLVCMAVPVKYRKMNTFYKYYSGEKVAPYLTIFIGGNHEASNYLGELAYGGWVCPKIYYLGYAGVVNVNGIRIAGLSGIYKGPDYLKGHFEVCPFTEDTKRSAYHIRSIDVFRLKQISQPLDIMLTHDWPRGIYHHGDTSRLLRRKPFFKAEIDNNTLGSRPAQDLLEKLQPKYWFSAHLHVKFAAVIQHSSDKDAKSDEEAKATKFLALDKCLPRRQFLQILDIGPEVGESEIPELSYDPEWLTILRITDHLLNVTSSVHYMPGPGCQERWDFRPTLEELHQTSALMGENLKVPLNFHLSVPPYDPNQSSSRKADAPISQPNSQTTDFCRKLGITDPLGKVLFSRSSQPSLPTISVDEFSGVPDECEAGVTLIEDPANVTGNVSCNQDEIALYGNDLSDDIKTASSDEFEISVKSAQTFNPSADNECNEAVSEVLNVSISNRPPSDGPPSKLKRRNLSLYKVDEDPEAN